MGVVDDYSSQACVYAYVTTAVNGSTQKDGYESVTVDRNNIICLPGDRQEKVPFVVNHDFVLTM